MDSDKGSLCEELVSRTLISLYTKDELEQLHTYVIERIEMIENMKPQQVARRVYKMLFELASTVEMRRELLQLKVAHSCTDSNRAQLKSNGLILTFSQRDSILCSLKQPKYLAPWSERFKGCWNLHNEFTFANGVWTDGYWHKELDQLQLPKREQAHPDYHIVLFIIENWRVLTDGYHEIWDKIYENNNKKQKIGV